MSYLDPRDGHASDDRSLGGGRDERSRARRGGAAYPPYGPDGGRPPYGADGGRPPYGADGGRAPYAPGEMPARYGNHDAANGSPWASTPEAFAGPTPVAAHGDNPVAYPLPPEPDAPSWDPSTAATSTAQAEYELGLATRVPGRRRAARTTTGDAGPAPQVKSKAGRNLPAAIGVGLGLGALIVVSLYIRTEIFVAVLAVAACVGIWEMVRALRVSGAKPPLIPLLGGGLLMVGLTLQAGADALAWGLLITVAAAMVWRLGDGPVGLRRDFTAVVLVAVYVPFLLSFAVLLVEPADGADRVVATVLAVVLSDTGGYAFGVFLGKHSMAPKISPNKSWEGFGGSVFAASAGSALVLHLLLDVPAYYGALFGVVIAVVAVLGDLTESMMKRDLGIKDMSQLLPGHGGLMDRLDSILFAVPAAYLLLSLIASPG